MSCPQLAYPRPVRRVRLRWRDGEWSIVKEMVIPQMTLPKPAELPQTQGGQGVSGFWWEATDAEGRVLYRQGAPDPTRPRVEIVDRDGAFRNLTPQSHEAILDVLVPDLPEIEEIRIFSDHEEGQERPENRKRPSRLTARIKIRQAGKEGGGHGDR